MLYSLIYHLLPFPCQLIQLKIVEICAIQGSCALAEVPGDLFALCTSLSIRRNSEHFVRLHSTVSLICMQTSRNVVEFHGI